MIHQINVATVARLLGWGKRKAGTGTGIFRVKSGRRSLVYVGKTCLAVQGFFSAYITRRNDAIIIDAEPR